MTQHQRSGSWLRTLYGLFAAAAVMTLAACGGGSGAPNNPYAVPPPPPPPPPLSVSPADVTVVAGISGTALTITGGVPPYFAFSSNPTVLPAPTLDATAVVVPLFAASVPSETVVNITIQDSASSTTVASVRVKPAPAGPAPLVINPGSPIIYSGIATTVTVSGGTRPYRAFSSNATILPVTQAVPDTVILLLAANVGAEATVTLTVQDAGGQTTSAAVTVRPAPLLNSLTITPSGSDCGTSAICSGQNGTAAVTVRGPEGGPLAGRQVKFDVITGPYGITAPTAGQPVVNTLTVTSDSTGKASVLIKANVNAPTQYAQLRVTELTSGQQLVGNFLIQQVTDGSKVLAVVPSEATITAAFKGECSSDVRIDYYIYGGIPPYRVRSSFPDAVTIVNEIVAESGGFFEAVTNGTCVNPLTFTIVDAAGRQTTATLKNLEGTADAPVVAPDLVVTSDPATPFTGPCTGKTFTFTVDGGTPPYNVSADKGTVTPQVVPSAKGQTSVFGLITGDKSTISIVDSTKPVQKSFTTSITCN